MDSILQFLHIDFLIKIGLLIVVGLYTIFAFFLLVQVRALNKILTIQGKTGSSLMVILCILTIMLSLSLFLYILAIL